MKIVSTTYEIEHDGYVYRLIHSYDGVFIKRVPWDKVYWYHGIYCQFLDESLQFKHALGITSWNYFETIALAKKFVESL